MSTTRATKRPKKISQTCWQTQLPQCHQTRHHFCRVLSQLLNAPCDSHWNVVMRILRYIKNAPGHGFLYEDEDNVKIVCYSSADWTGVLPQAIVFCLEGI